MEIGQVQDIQDDNKLNIFFNFFPSVIASVLTIIFYIDTKNEFQEHDNYVPVLKMALTGLCGMVTVVSFSGAFKYYFCDHI